MAVIYWDMKDGKLGMIDIRDIVDAYSAETIDDPINSPYNGNDTSFTEEMLNANHT